jgi:hypothetical protein
MIVDARVLTTIVATEATATAVATSTGAANGSLGLDVALAGASVHLVNGLDRDGRLLLAVRVIACRQDAWSASIIPF